jgi:hypothetical protein
MQQVGQEFFLPPTNNNSGVQINNGEFVMVTGIAGNSDRMSIAKAVTDGSVNPMYMVGVATFNIPNGSEIGKITTNGLVRGVNTNAWIKGTILYPNPAVQGGWTNAVPTAPAIKTPIAIVIRQGTSNGILYIRMTNGSRLGETDSNVEFVSLADKQMIAYNGANSRWENTTNLGWDFTNSRLGVGTASPNSTLSISSPSGFTGTGNDTYGAVDVVSTETGASGAEIGPLITFRGRRGAIDSTIASYAAIGAVNTGLSGSSTGALVFKTKSSTGAAQELVEQMRISTGGNVNINNALTIGGALTVGGDLTINGTTTTLNANTLTVDDKNIELGSVVTKTGLVATLSTGVNTVTLTTGNTSGVIPGQVLAKTSGTGAFGTNAVVGAITSATQFTVVNAAGAALNHATAGSITFSIQGASDSSAVGGGITLKGTTDKTITWDATNGWNSSEKITASEFVGALTGNASTATTLQTARTIELSGDVTGSADFDGSGNINITATVADDSHNHIISDVDGLQTLLNSLSGGNKLIGLIDVTDPTNIESTYVSTTSMFYGNLTIGQTIRRVADGLVYTIQKAATVNATTTLESYFSGGWFGEAFYGPSNPFGDPNILVSQTLNIRLKKLTNNILLDDFVNNQFQIGNYISFIKVEDVIEDYDSIVFKRWNGNSWVDTTEEYFTGDWAIISQLTGGIPTYIRLKFAIEVDTLATVTGRGATTADAISITNSTGSTTTGTGALIVTGGVGIGGSANIGGSLTVGGDGIIFEGTNNLETTLVAVDPTADQTYRLPNKSAGTYTIATTTDLPTVNNGGLELEISGTAGATNTTITVETGDGFFANNQSDVTYTQKVGPALTALASTMTGTGTGFLKKTAQDTYTLDTSTYLTSESSLVVNTTGSGNAVTSVTNTGHTISVTKGSTFLTSYTETDTLNSVTSRASGNITTNAITTSAYNMGTSSSTATKATMQYNSTDNSIDFVFAD